ncbi:uncharacterized protein LOC118184920 [Stegodyphus dumicola]|uniref:uncharacterized protein LOC118184920 n=1 Tax=Stegodyphus dumicola TaxID=202533 RepID=UPI0015AF19D0|nr:uncharacterized protein LOC118184920 [Stegodyphus dumicola]
MFTWLKFTTTELEEAWKYKLSSKDIFACKQHLHNWPHRKLLPVLASLPLEILPHLPQELSDRNLSSAKENLELLQRKSRRRRKEINYRETKSDEEKESDSEYQPSSENSNSSVNVKHKKILKKKKEIPETSMTEYQKKIQKNIEERLMFLKSLKLDEAKQDFLELIKKPKRVHRPVPPPPPREKSSRLLQKEKVSFNLQTMINEAHKKAKEEMKEKWRKKDLIIEILKWHEKKHREHQKILRTNTSNHVYL